MKRIYLDQNKWIDMAAAGRNLSKGARYQDVLTLARAGVKHGYASFPLSSIHYVETSKRRPWKARQDLAHTMADLSRFHTIAPLTVLIPPEIDLALQHFFGRPLVARKAQVFGIGVSHALDHPLRRFRVPEDTAIDSEFKRQFEDWAALQTEWIMLAGLPAESGIDEREFDAAQHAVGERLARQQEKAD